MGMPNQAVHRGLGYC